MEPYKCYVYMHGVYIHTYYYALATYQPSHYVLTSAAMIYRYIDICHDM